MKKIFSVACLIFIAVCIFSFSVVKESVPVAIEMCIVSLVPSVFIFSVLSSVIIDCGIPSAVAKPLAYIFNKLFGISSCSAMAVILGWTAGFPVGAVSVRRLYESGRISRDEAEYLLSFCSISGISFVFGVMGGVVYGDMKIAFVLYFIQIFSSVAVGLFMKDTKVTHKTEYYESSNGFNISETMVLSVRNGVRNTAYICGYVVFFSALCNIILFLFPFIPEFLLRAVLEMTSSSFLLKSFPFKTSLILASALLSWSGICIHLQIHNCIKDISAKKYYVGKILHVGISSLITLLLPISDNITAYRECINVNYRSNSPDLFFIIIFFVVLGCFFLNNDVK